jgi:XTP/dITP diphosphohydrolase
VSARVRLLVATRNSGKVREIGEILAGYPEIEVVGLADLDVPVSPGEDEIEAFDTFEENAVAKARHFAALTGYVTLADDSGICVDALGGAPGVRSRRFAERGDLRGPEQDRANNDLLVQRLAGREGDERAARYVCAAAVAWPDGREAVFRGECAGLLLESPRGSGGFGYDPLMYLPAENATFGELAPERKNELSHRGKAVRGAAEHLRRQLDDGGPSV